MTAFPLDSAELPPWSKSLGEGSGEPPDAARQGSDGGSLNRFDQYDALCGGRTRMRGALPLQFGGSDCRSGERSFSAIDATRCDAREPEADPGSGIIGHVGSYIVGIGPLGSKLGRQGETRARQVGSRRRSGAADCVPEPLPIGFPRSRNVAP